MTRIGDVLEEQLKGREGSKAGAVADTWFTLGITTHEIHAMLAAYFLQQKKIFTRITAEVEEEHKWNYSLTPEHEKYLDSEGVPKGPVSLESIIEERTTDLVVRTLTENRADILANQRLTPTDKLVALEAKKLAQTFGHCYVVTNDTALIQQLQKTIREQNLNITLLMPSTIERDLSKLLPQLGMSLLIPSKVLAQLYRIGMEEQQNINRNSERAYVKVLRQEPYALGRTTIRADTAKDVVTEGIPPVLREVGFPVFSTDKYANPIEYGIPVRVVKDLTEDELYRALKGFEPVPRNFKLFLLPEAQKYRPAVIRVNLHKAAGKDAFRGLRWARI